MPHSVPWLHCPCSPGLQQRRPVTQHRQGGTQECIGWFTRCAHQISNQNGMGGSNWVLAAMPFSTGYHGKPVAVSTCSGPRSRTNCCSSRLRTKMLPANATELQLRWVANGQGSRGQAEHNHSQSRAMNQRRRRPAVQPCTPDGALRLLPPGGHKHKVAGAHCGEGARQGTN